MILLRSLYPTGELCNGTQRQLYDSEVLVWWTILALPNRIIDAEIATGVHKGKRVFIPRIPMTPTDTHFPFVLRSRQFPIRPAFCVTINKGQGQSM